MNIQEKIEHYIEGLLSDEEKREFEEKMQEDPELEALVMKRGQLASLLSEKFRYPTEPLQPQDGGILLDHTQDMEIDDDLYRFYYHFEDDREENKKLEKLIRDAKNTGNSAHSSTLFILLNLAATILIVAIVAAGLSKMFHEKNMDKLYRQLYLTNFQPDQDSRLANLEPATKNDTAENNGSEFEPGISTTEPEMDHELFRNNSGHDISLIKYSVAKMKQQDFNLALIPLQEVIRHDNPEYTSIAKWYYGLTLLKTGKPEEAASVFHSLCQSHGDYSELSCSILEDISEK